jgi:hypothetical protein
MQDRPIRQVWSHRSKDTLYIYQRDRLTEEDCRISWLLSRVMVWTAMSSLISYARPSLTPTRCDVMASKTAEVSTKERWLLKLLLLHQLA